MPDEIAEAPDLGIGPTPQDPATKVQTPAPFLAPPESTPAAPPESVPEVKQDGPAEAPFDWTTVDLRRAKETDVPEKERPLFRVLQKRERDQQAEGTRRAQDLDARERRLEDQSRRIEAIEKRLSQGPPSAMPEKAEVAKKKIADLIADPDTDPDVRDAVQLMRDGFEEMWTEKMGDRIPKIDAALPVIEKMTAQERNDDQTALVVAINEARDLYGDDIDGYTANVMWRCGYDWNSQAHQWVRARPSQINIGTGQPHTITSAYELEAGITARASTALREEDGKQRAAAKARAAPGATRPSPPDGKVLSESEARRQVESIGFGKT